jgi:HEPN domain-containing protein
MKNFESGERLIKDAEIYYEEMIRAFERKRWNIVIRRAQEVVELALKGILKIGCIDYPKVHDVAPLFVKFVKEKKLEVDEKILEKIQKASSKLLKERAPAFYGEKIYSKEEAKEAFEDAKEILEFIKNLKIKLMKGEKLK